MKLAWRVVSALRVMVTKVPLSAADMVTVPKVTPVPRSVKAPTPPAPAVKSAMEEAVDNGLLPENPCRKVKLPKIKDKETDFLEVLSAWGPCP